ncbi:MAG: winged helix-turn-helix transcriptional regulator [Chloroflexi bacterium]|nr:winged helix-turn-helix transcriptional regulator [Chloroflexota bacterium]
MARESLVERMPGTRCCAGDIAPLLDPVEAQRLSDDFQILGHPVRLQILDVLARHAGQVCVCDLEAAVPVKQPTVSHHLRLLREAGLVDAERHGQWVYYFIRQDVFAGLRARVARALAALCNVQQPGAPVVRAANGNAGASPDHGCCSPL